MNYNELQYIRMYWNELQCIVMGMVIWYKEWSYLKRNY